MAKLRTLLTRQFRMAAAVAALASGTACASGGGFGGGAADGEAERAGPLESLPVSAEVFVDTASGAFVLIDLDSNMLRFMDGDVVLWEAPVGTGTGLRLASDDTEWHFTTPRGVFQAKFKEELPVWYLPDWYFLERNQPVPPQNSPSRRLEGQLGVAAVYLGEEIAIHGTDRPELLGQRVSHGCIRLENRFVQRLYHNVQIGTPIVIVGGEHLDRQPPAPTPTPGPATPRPPDALAGVPTAEILTRLERQLSRSCKRTRTIIPAPTTTHRCIFRSA